MITLCEPNLRWILSIKDSDQEIVLRTEGNIKGVMGDLFKYLCKLGPGVGILRQISLILAAPNGYIDIGELPGIIECNNLKLSVVNGHKIYIRTEIEIEKLKEQWKS